MDHISVCICTFKRPELLKRLLDELRDQETGGLFTYSLVVADNDPQHTGEAVVQDFAATSSIPIAYCVEPQQNISRARNRAIARATGNLIAHIDDDEFPTKNWLLDLLKALYQYKVDGVLGPVLPHFDEGVPSWVIKGKFYDRKTYPTGTTINWREGRTGNVLFKRTILPAGEEPFRTEYHRGGDTDFFRRMVDKGYTFIWSGEAVVYEVVPPARWTRTFLLQRALLRGAILLKNPNFGARDIVKSLLATPIYILALPFALLGGHHRFMGLMVRLCDHLGKLLAVLGIRPESRPHVTD